MLSKRSLRNMDIDLIFMPAFAHVSDMDIRNDDEEESYPFQQKMSRSRSLGRLLCLILLPMVSQLVGKAGIKIHDENTK